MIFSQEKLEEQYKKMPADLQEAISSADIAQKIQEIANKYQLQLDEADELFEETGFVMLALTHPNEYINNLKKRLPISEEKINNIAKDINEQIFLPIRESLRLIHEKENTITDTNINKDVVQKKESELVREEILRGIEQPIPKPEINNKLFAEKKEIPLSATITPEIKIVENTAPKEELLIEESKSLIEEKLEKPIVIPQEKIEISEKKIEKEIPAYKNTIDPYREPIE